MIKKPLVSFIIHPQYRNNGVFQPDFSRYLCSVTSDEVLLEKLTYSEDVELALSYTHMIGNPVAGGTITGRRIDLRTLPSVSQEIQGTRISFPVSIIQEVRGFDTLSGKLLEFSLRDDGKSMMLAFKAELATYSEREAADKVLDFFGHHLS